MSKTKMTLTRRLPRWLLAPVTGCCKLPLVTKSISTGFRRSLYGRALKCSTRGHTTISAFLFFNRVQLLSTLVRYQARGVFPEYIILFERTNQVSTFLKIQNIKTPIRIFDFKNQFENDFDFISLSQEVSDWFLNIRNIMWSRGHSIVVINIYIYR